MSTVPGIYLSGTQGEHTVRVKALHLHEVQNLYKEPVGIAFICTKSYDTEWATMMIKQYLAPNGFVVSLQNSINEERSANIVGWGKVVGCIASTIGVDVYKAGHIMRTREPGGSTYTIFRVGEVYGRITPRVQEIVRWLSVIDSAKATTNLWGERWGKLTRNSMGNGISACTGMNSRAMTEWGTSRRLSIRLAGEAIKVGLALGYEIEPIQRMPSEQWVAASEGDPAALEEVEGSMLAGMKRMTEDGRPSTAQDMLNGLAAAKGEEVGIPAPTHAALTEVVKRVERGEIDAHPRNVESLSSKEDPHPPFKPLPEGEGGRRDTGDREKVMLDYVIKGGQVVTPGGVGQWDIGIRGEKIVAIAEPGSLTDTVGRVIDASGKIVIPGGIEPHAHVAAPIMGRPGMETAPPDQVSRAAMFGGTTTLVDFAIQGPDRDIFQAIEERHGRWQGQSYSDYTYHCMLLGDIPTEVMAQIPQVIDAGFPTFKVFTTNIRPTTSDRMARLGHVAAVMEEVAANNGLLVVHAEDDDIVQFLYRRLKDQGTYDWTNMHKAHTNMSEDISFRRVIRAAEWTGAAVYFVHVSAKEGVQAIREARGKGLPIYGETLHNYVSFTADDYQKPNGMKYHTYPSLKSEDDRQALWNGLLKGDIHTMATDEYCTDYALKVEGKTIEDVTGGHNGAETRVGITYTEGVVKRGMSLEHFVNVTSANAARLLGLYPRKGAIAPGSDADIVFIDPAIHKMLSMADLHISDYSIWEGWEIHGWPTFTMLRGKVMVENGRMVGTQGTGQLIPRKIDSGMLSRPRL